MKAICLNITNLVVLRQKKLCKNLLIFVRNCRIIKNIKSDEGGDMRKLIKIILDDGEEIFIETEDPYLSYADESPRQSVSSGPCVIQESGKYLERAMAQIRTFSSKIVESIKDIPSSPDEFEVEFSGQFSAEAGIVFTSLSSQAGVTITLRWKKGE